MREQTRTEEWKSRTPRAIWGVLGWVGLVSGGLLVGCGEDVVEPGATAGSGPVEEEFTRAPEGLIRRSGEHLVDARGRKVLLQGVSFGNAVWAGAAEPPAFHHDERDFKRLQEMGMNLVRFYLNYQLFESDAEPYVYREEGWQWLDQNIAWAKAHGVRLLLNMHVPQGGFQSTGGGNALWTERANQERLIALWKAIAARYKEEDTILGYDLLNEPRPPESRSQWEDFAKEMVREVRTVNERQLIVVERTNSVGEDWSSDAEMNFFLVPDENILYQFHTYAPFEYTHQLAEWTGLGDGGKYPDESIVSGVLNWHSWSWSPEAPPYLEEGDTDWHYYESPAYEVPEGNFIVAPVLVSEFNAGTVWFDDLVVKEFDAEGQLTRTLMELDLESADGWEFWKEGELGEFSVSEEAHSGRASFRISGTDHDANLQSTSLRFLPRPGHRYAIGGYMKGENIVRTSRPDPRGDWTQESRALFRLDFWEAEGTVLTRGKEALAQELDLFLAWGKKQGVPLYLGEFGLIYHCFENEKGGLHWVEDMLDLLLERNVHFTYHSYHEWAFPIFQGDPTKRLPQDEDAVPGLRELFTRKLKGARASLTQPDPSAAHLE